MANWVKGKLKIRGKPEDIKRWVEECLHCYFTKWFRDGSYEDELVDVKQSQKAGNNAIQIQQTVVGDNNYVVGIEIENDSRKPNDNQPKRSLLRRLVAFLNDMVAAIIDALEL